MNIPCEKCRPAATLIGVLALAFWVIIGLPRAIPVAFATDSAPVPLLKDGHPVDWWFVFKLNGSDFPGCTASGDDQRTCTFDKNRKPPTKKYSPIGQRFIYASSEDPELKEGAGCTGETATDPLGATFGDVFKGSYNYVVWNDQPDGHPKICGNQPDCGTSWGHSKGLLAWNDAGEGLVLQVTTPSWPLSASAELPRKGDANTLGCVANNNVKLSQHFFALRLTKDDVISVLKALQNASAPTDPSIHSIANNGGPSAIEALVKTLHAKALSTTVTSKQLSTGVILISKPARLKVPPWQMVSATLGGTSLKVASFHNSHDIADTTGSTKVTCWDAALPKPGAVTIAKWGRWGVANFDLQSGHNHAKIALSTGGNHHYTIFGDMNQVGALTPPCNKAQNVRGGLFFVLDNESLFESVTGLLNGSQPR